MSMSLIVDTHYQGQTSGWLNAENHRVVAWAGRTFGSPIEARRAADYFKTCSATAEFEIHDAAHGRWRWVPGTPDSRWLYRPPALPPNRMPDAQPRSCGPEPRHPVDPRPQPRVGSSTAL
jgi:hypothetical protein